MDLPLHQQGTNKLAREEERAVEVELALLVGQVAKETGSDTIVRSTRRGTLSQGWAGRNAEAWTGGTMYPLIYHTAFRFWPPVGKELQMWLEEFRERSG